MFHHQRASDTKDSYNVTRTRVQTHTHAHTHTHTHTHMHTHTHTHTHTCHLGCPSYPIDYRGERPVLYRAPEELHRRGWRPIYYPNFSHHQFRKKTSLCTSKLFTSSLRFFFFFFLGQALVAVILYHERRIGIRSSGLLFLYWMSLVLYGAFKLLLASIAAHDSVRKIVILFLRARSLSFSSSSPPVKLLPHVYTTPVLLPPASSFLMLIYPSSSYFLFIFYHYLFCPLMT